MQALENLPSSYRFHIEKLFKNFVSAIVYDFITNMLNHYGNDKDDNVSFYYSGGFLRSLLLLLIIMEILNDIFRVGNIVTIIISIL